MSIRNTCPPMEIETVTDTTVPNHDETEIESTEFEKNQKRYQDLISTFPHVKGWRFKDPFIRYGGQWWIQTILEGSLYAQEFFQARPRDFFICSYLKTGTTWLKSLTFIIANRSRFDDSTNPLLKRNPHELIPFFEIEFPLFPQSLPDSVVKKGCKMVYIWRDPKDTFISLWHFFQKKSFETLKNLEVNKGDKEREDHPSPFTKSAYFRKGKTGDWVNYLTPDMAARIDGIMEEKFKGTGLLEYEPALIRSCPNNHFSSHTDQKHMSSNLLPLSPMATETVRDSTVPNHDETELTEFQRIRNGTKT
ncbi:unnamed protein product [Brassica oleracea]